MKKALNVKQMINTYKNCTNWDDAQDVWNTFRNMYGMGFITWGEWDKFYQACHDYEMFDGEAE